MGLEATVRDAKDDRTKGTGEDPITYLATWLLRNNPKHSAQGRVKLEKFAAELESRAPLTDVAALEEQQQLDAAVKMQAAARGHTSRLMAGELKRGKAAEKVQAMARGRAARKDMQEIDAAAVQVQSAIRGRNERLKFQQEREAEAKAQQAAATAVQSVMRGRLTRGTSAPPGGRSAPPPPPASAED